MLTWVKDYYVGEGIKNHLRTRRKIDEGKPVLGIYLITLSDNTGNLLEIIPAYMLLQKSFYAICPSIVGMAKGKDAAMDMAVGIIKKIYETTGEFRVKEFFENR